MLTHLVQNAIDASAPDAPIHVRLRPSGGSIRLVVEDRGHGMSRSFIRDELFRPFRSTKDGGFGIGAYEAREIVRAHGGRMDVSSRPGEGSRFELLLPMTKDAGRKVERT
jgi:signal transduction histidine kinase